jgi:hypothetical protein
VATNSAVIRVGRLLEIRVGAGYKSDSDVALMSDALRATLAKLPRSQKVVTIADWRSCQILESKASERMLERLVALNARTERSAVIASPQSSVAVLQFMRLIRESRLPDRKVFLDPSDVLPWLDEVLDPQEQHRLRQFLGV